MSGLYSLQGIASFGPTRLGPSSELPRAYQVFAARSSVLKAKVRRECPRRPGVYGMLDAAGKLIYVGKAKSLRARLLSYFRPKSRDPKAGRIVANTRTILWEGVPSEFAALLRELELIHRWRPPFNVLGQPGRRRPVYVCVGRRPAPYVFLSRRIPSGVLAWYGPIHGGHRARQAVRRVNDWYRLRDCPQAQEMAFADQGELFPVVRAAGCLRYEIGACLGPCAAACTRTAYLDGVQAARAFLDGTDLAPLATLERDMAAASAEMAFERAVLLRDKLEDLNWLRGQLERLKQARERHSFVYPVRGHEGNDLWYLIHRGQVCAVLPAPQTAGGRRAVAEAARAVYQGNRISLACENVESILLVAAWFRRHPEEYGRTMSPAVVL